MSKPIELKEDNILAASKVNKKGTIVKPNINEN